MSILLHEERATDEMLTVDVYGMLEPGLKLSSTGNACVHKQFVHLGTCIWARAS